MYNFYFVIYTKVLFFKPLKPLVLIASKNNKTKKKTLSKNVKKKC